MMEVGDRALVFKEGFGAGFLKQKCTETLEKMYRPERMEACIDLSKGYHLNIAFCQVRWVERDRQVTIQTTVAKIVALLICAKYRNDCTWEPKLNIPFSPNYIWKYISHTHICCVRKPPNVSSAYGFFVHLMLYFPVISKFSTANIFHFPNQTKSLHCHLIFA